MPDLASLSARYLPLVTELRRDLHQHPELSGSEQRTAEVVAAALSPAGYSLHTGVGGHGVVAVLGSGEPCVALRADMDALPIQEQTGLPWQSENPGVMHACGHDFHTAWLVGVGLMLAAAGPLTGSVKLIFQPAEEALGGAAGMIADGTLEAPAPRVIIGAHVWPDHPAGTIGLRPGHNLAAADRFQITLTGQGTHGATPHKGHDPVLATAELVLALQSLVTRRLDPLSPAVLSVCQLQAGTAFNIIPGTATLGGTVRTVSPTDRQAMHDWIAAVSRDVAAVHGCSADVDYEFGVPPTVTDPGLTARAGQVLADIPGVAVVEAQPSMGAEDFSYYLEHCPGVLLWVGCGPADGQAAPSSLHDPCFVGAEECLAPAMVSLAALALDCLSSAPG